MSGAVGRFTTAMKRIERARRVTRKRKPSARRGDIIARFYAALDRKMKEIEERLQGSGEGHSAADSERDARTLTSLARLYEKIVDLEGAEEKSEQQGEANGGGHDADRQREAIAERIAFAPITYSQNRDTVMTIAQIRGHNAAWDAICPDGE